MFKLRPLMDKFRDRCFANFIPTPLLNYDESMVKFFGRHQTKQFLPGKSIRFGFKMWCINSNDGYLLNFDLYQGSNPKITAIDDQLFGKCSSPFIMMLDEFPEKIKKLPYHFFFDNLFSGVNLFRYLEICGYSATGTFRENSIPHSKKQEAERQVVPKGKAIKKSKNIRKKSLNIIDEKTFATKDRGAMESFLEKI